MRSVATTTDASNLSTTAAPTARAKYIHMVAGEDSSAAGRTPLAQIGRKVDYAPVEQDGAVRAGGAVGLGSRSGLVSSAARSRL
jgi:hypothetical protein